MPFCYFVAFFFLFLFLSFTLCAVILSLNFSKPFWNSLFRASCNPTRKPGGNSCYVWQYGNNSSCVRKESTGHRKRKKEWPSYEPFSEHKGKTGEKYPRRPAIHSLPVPLLEVGIWHKASQKQKQSPSLPLWSLQSTVTNFSTIASHSKLVLRMRFAKHATKLKKICGVGFQGETHKPEVPQRKKDDK